MTTPFSFSRLFSAALVVVFCFAFFSTLSAQDKRVESALDDAGIDWSTSESGNYRMVLDVPEGNGRTHLIFVAQKAMEFRSFEIREVYGIVYKSDIRPSQRQYEELLQKNESVKMGFFSLIENDGEYIVYFNAVVDANIDGKGLEDAINAVMQVADQMELEMTGEDEF